MRFIHAADIHLDSPLAGMPQRHSDLALVIATCTRDAFTNLIDHAIAYDVDFLLIAGDLYDTEHKNYETGLFFAREMQRFGRPCILIHGNHDSASQITKSLQAPPNVTILPSRRPGTVMLEQHGVAVHGQSFHGRAEQDELAGAYPARVEGAFNIGLLHSSMDNPGHHARYAPCRLDTLMARNYDYWALGHIHTRVSLHEAPWVHFPGNTQGRHVRETGPRGVTLVEVDDNQKVVSLTFLATDVLRWAVATVDATGIDTLETLAALVRFELDAAVRDAEGRPAIVRVQLEGVTPLHPILVADPTMIDAVIRAAAAAVSPDLHIEKVKHLTTPAGTTNGDLAALEAAVRAALADPVLVTGILRDFDRLRNTLPETAQVPASRETLAELQDDAWAIIHQALIGSPA